MIMNKHIETSKDENNPITNGIEISFFRKCLSHLFEEFLDLEAYETVVSC